MTVNPRVFTADLAGNPPPELIGLLDARTHAAITAALQGVNVPSAASIGADPAGAAAAAQAAAIAAAAADATAKIPTAATLSGTTTVGRNLLIAPDPATARTAIGAEVAGAGSTAAAAAVTAAASDASTKATAAQTAAAADATAKVAAEASTRAASVALAKTVSYNINQFVQTNDTWAADGTANCSVVVQRAVDYLHALAVQVPARIYFPAGTYRLDTAIRLYSNTGIEGESEAGTVFLPPVADCGFVGYGALNTPLADIDFLNFTIDGARQTSGGYTTGIKGMWISYMLRPRWSHVTIKNCWATGLGCDFLIDFVMDHVTAIGNGRGVTTLGVAPDSVSGGSGIGIGTGMSQYEGGVITSPTVKNNGRIGLFAEAQFNNGATYYSRGVKVTGGVSSGNWIGYHDCGWDGAEVSMAVIDNLRAGVLLDLSTLAPRGGVNGIFRGEIARNGSASVTNSGGVVIAAAPLGRYKFGGICHDNVIGVLTTSTSTVGPGMTFDLDVFNNLGSGYLIQGPAGTPIASLLIAGTCRNNGQSGSQTYRDGVTLIADTKLFDLTARCTDDQSSKTQQYGLQTLGSGRNMTAGNLAGDVRSAVAGAWNNTQTVSNDTRVALIGSDTTGPSNLIAATTSTAGGTSVTLTWTAPIPYASVTDYAVQYRTSPGGSWTTFAHTASTAASQTVTGLTTNTAYDFQVAAVTAGGTGAYTAGPVTATPTQLPLYADTFTRADSASSIGSTDSGTHAAAAWTIAGSSVTWGIVGNKARPTTGGLTAAYIDTATSGGTHKATLASVNVAASGGLAFRIQDESNLLYIALKKTGASSNDYAIQKRVAGTNSVILDLTTAPAAGDVIKVIDNAGTNTITVFINGVQKGSIVNTQFAGLTKAGLHGSFTADGSTGYANWSYSTAQL